jgi:hypothetical protein
MHRILTVLAVCFLNLAFLAGCDGGKSSSTPRPARTGWLGFSSTAQHIVEWLHEGTGWVLNKSQVSVVKEGEVRAVTGASHSHVADFKITVTKGNNTFETTARDVPCDKDGIPTEESVTKLREAVEVIKDKIKRLQN